jgi:hypothetical protein
MMIEVQKKLKAMNKTNKSKKLGQLVLTTWSC